MDLFSIKKCFNCPNRLFELESIEKAFNLIMNELDFNQKMAAKVNTSRPMHHQIFHLALAGCPNSCSQPQIKDFSVVGQAVPECGSDCNGCGTCAGACPEKAIEVKEQQALINRELCLNCGQCIRACPSGAMQVARSGLKVMAGGKLGRHPRLASQLVALAGPDDAAKALSLCINLVLQEGRPGERFGDIINRTNFKINNGELNSPD